MHVNERWGQLEVIDMDFQEVTEHPYEGITSTSNVIIAKLKCNCGKVFEIRRDQFPGKRRMKDCGCGIAKTDGLCVMTAMSLPFSLMQTIKAFADKETKSNKSRAMQILMRRGIQHYELETGTKIEKKA